MKMKIVTILMFASEQAKIERKTENCVSHDILSSINDTEHLSRFDMIKSSKLHDSVKYRHFQVGKFLKYENKMGINQRSAGIV